VKVAMTHIIRESARNVSRTRRDHMTLTIVVVGATVSTVDAVTTEEITTEVGNSEAVNTEESHSEEETTPTGRIEEAVSITIISTRTLKEEKQMPKVPSSLPIRKILITISALWEVEAVEATAEEEIIEAAIRIEIEINKILQLRVKRGLRKVEPLPQLNPSRVKRKEEAIVDVVDVEDSEETMTVLMKTPVLIPSIETRALPKWTSNISSSILAHQQRDHWRSSSLMNVASSSSLDPTETITRDNRTIVRAIFSKAVLRLWRREENNLPYLTMSQEARELLVALPLLKEVTEEDTVAVNQDLTRTWEPLTTLKAPNILLRVVPQVKLRCERAFFIHFRHLSICDVLSFINTHEALYIAWHF
jgi:hypothetical protein